MDQTKQLPIEMLVWRNGRWEQPPHRHFFVNMLKEHIRKIEGYDNKRIENIRIEMMLENGQILHVNNGTFRVVDWHRRQQELKKKEAAA